MCTQLLCMQVCMVWISAWNMFCRCLCMFCYRSSALFGTCIFAVCMQLLCMQVCLVYVLQVLVRPFMRNVHAICIFYTYVCSISAMQCSACNVCAALYRFISAECNRCPNPGVFHTVGTISCSVSLCTPHVVSAQCNHCSHSNHCTHIARTTLHC